MAYGLAQFFFEFLFDSLEELNIVSAREQPAQEQGKPFGLLSVSPSNLACKKVREGWACGFSVVSPPRSILIYTQPLPKEVGGLSPRARNPKVT